MFVGNNVNPNSRRPALQAWPLIMAMDSHTRRPLKCRFCQRSYKYRRSLKMHIKEIHHNEALKLKDRSLEAIKSYIKAIHAAKSPGKKDLPQMSGKENLPESIQPKRTISVIIRNPNSLPKIYNK